MDLGLSGRTALVTGASRGIGRGIAEALAAEGCHLELVARNAEMLEELAGSLAGEHGVRARAYAYDLAEPANQKAVVAACGHADVVVNNAGATQPGEIDEVDEDAWMEGWRLKVFGYINMTRHYWRIMKARGSGVIVNIVGDSGERPVAAVISSSTANAALIAFTRALGGRSPQFGFRVVGVNPAAIETDRVYWYMRARADKDARQRRALARASGRSAFRADGGAEGHRRHGRLPGLRPGILRQRLHHERRRGPGGAALTLASAPFYNF